MDITTARNVIEELASDLNGMELWRMETERSRMGTYVPDPKNPGKQLWRPALKTGYGEAVLEEVHRILSGMEIHEGEVFYDLGSGLGKVVLMAALCFPFSRLVGIELLSALDDGAQELLARYQLKVRPTLPEDKKAQEIEFINEDMFKVNVRSADVVFAQSTYFDHHMMFSLAVKLDQLKQGARVITMGQPLINPRKLVVVKELSARMPWGEAQVTLYEQPRKEGASEEEGEPEAQDPDLVAAAANSNIEGDD